MEVLNNILNAVAPAAEECKPGPAAQKIVAAMVGALPLVIGWLAKIVALGKLSDGIKEDHRKDPKARQRNHRLLYR